MKSMRPATLQTLDMGSVMDIINSGHLPVNLEELVDQVFGDKNNRGAMIISGAGGVVGAGKVMQFAARLREFSVPVIAVDLPDAGDGLSKKIAGLQASFGQEQASAIMSQVIRLNYDGKSIPEALYRYQPKLLLEAIPEKLDLKRSHYALFREAFPDIFIWSVTSGFPAEELGVAVAHPAFPHEINKVFEMVEKQVSPATKLLYAMGLIPMRVSDHWSFVLDVFFCGLMQAGIRFCEITNMPYWKADKYIRQLMGPNPFRAHDVIGAKGSNFLTWSCLHHLSLQYGPLFAPAETLTERKESGAPWYPAGHLRPMVNWSSDAEELELLKSLVYGSLIQMTTIILHEKRADLSTVNMIGELCAQFTNGILATIRRMGFDEACNWVNKFHKICPDAAETKWYPDCLKDMESTAWQQLYVNAEHDGTTGCISLSRESYNQDVNDELNRAIDWLKKEGIEKVVLCSDFHFSTQMVGADTTEFYAAIENKNIGQRISFEWSKTARRLYHEFETTVGLVTGKRCMGGMLELMMHCHYLVATKDVAFAMPEVTLPVIPGMEGCHWVLRKSTPAERPAMLEMLMDGKSVKANQASGFLVDFCGDIQECLHTTRLILHNGDAYLKRKHVSVSGIDGIDEQIKQHIFSSNPQLRLAQEQIAGCVLASCISHVDDAIEIQAKLSAEFMSGPLFRKGKIGLEYDKTVLN